MAERETPEPLSSLTTEKGFKSQRILAHYIDEGSRPVICATAQLIASGNMPIVEAQIKSLRKAIDRNNEIIDDIHYFCEVGSWLGSGGCVVERVVR